jgi:hypothetical protein
MTQESGSARTVENYDYYREGDIDPYLGKKIVTLILKTDKFIVYIDEDSFVEWAFTSAYGELNSDCGKVLNRVTQVQAFPLEYLTQQQKSTFRGLVGEAVARVLSDRTPVRAKEALDAALEWVEGRNREIARRWYLTASAGTAAIVAGVSLILWLGRSAVTAFIGRTAFEVTLGACLGGLGAFLFILGRSKDIRFDPAATKTIHQYEGIARVLAGCIGAALVALGIKGGILFGSLAGSANPLAALLALCMISGVSERFVANFVERTNFKNLSKSREGAP